MSTFRLNIMASTRAFYSGEAEVVTVPTTEGSIGILAHHSNTIMAIVPGTLEFVAAGEGTDGSRTLCAVSYGLLKVENNEVDILVETLETPDEIDVNRALKAEAKAKEALLQKRSHKEYMQANVDLARAMNRLKVARMK